MLKYDFKILYIYHIISLEVANPSTDAIESVSRCVSLVVGVVLVSHFFPVSLEVAFFDR